LAINTNVNVSRAMSVCTHTSLISSRSTTKTTQYASISFDEDSVYDCNPIISKLLLTKMGYCRVLSVILAVLTFVASLIQNSFVLQHECNQYIGWKYIEWFYLLSPMLIFTYFLTSALMFDGNHTWSQNECTHCTFKCCDRRLHWRWSVLWDSLSCTFIVVFCTFCVWYFGFSWHFVLLWMNFQLILRGWDEDTIHIYKFLYFDCKHDYREKLDRCVVMHKYLFSLFEHSHRMIEKKNAFKLDEYQEKLKLKIWKLYYEPQKYASQMRFNSLVSVGHTNHIYIFLLLYYMAFYIIYQTLPILHCARSVDDALRLLLLLVWNSIYLVYFLYIWYRFSDPLNVLYAYDAETFQLLHVKKNSEIQSEIHAIYQTYKLYHTSQVYLQSVFGKDVTNLLLEFLNDEQINVNYAQQLMRFRRATNR